MFRQILSKVITASQPMLRLRLYSAPMMEPSASKFICQMKDVNKVVGNQIVLLRNANFSFLRGAKIGLIGINGTVGRSGEIRLFNFLSCR